MEDFCFVIPSDLVSDLYDALYTSFERRSFALGKMKSLRPDYVNPSIEGCLKNLGQLLHDLNFQYEEFLEDHGSKCK